jgi:hypothetical protein
MKPASGSSRSRNSRSKRKNHEWSGRTDLVTYDVFKRMYWPQLPRSSTKGVCAFFTFISLLALIQVVKHQPSHSVNLLVWLAVVLPFLQPLKPLQVPSRDQRNHWITQTALSTGRRMKTLGTRTKWTIRYSRRIKVSSSSVVSATSRTGELRRSLHMTILAQAYASQTPGRICYSVISRKTGLKESSSTLRELTLPFHLLGWTW